MGLVEGMAFLMFLMVELCLGTLFILLSLVYFVKRRKIQDKRSLVLFRVLLGFNVLALLFVGWFLVGIAKPYIDVQHIRASTSPETFVLRYSSYACGDYFPQMVEVLWMNKGGPVVADEPFRLALPDGIPSPEDTDLAVGANLFRVKGYRYTRRETNIITGTIVETPSDRLDVFFWEVITPYHIWEPSEHGTHKKLHYDPVQYFKAPQGLKESDFIMGHYNPC